MEGESKGDHQCYLTAFEAVMARGVFIKANIKTLYN